MEPWTKRTVIRAVLASVLALLGSLVTASVDGAFGLGEIMAALFVGLGAGAAWFGVGSQSSSVEPFLNNSEPGAVVVPKPPAKPEAVK